MMGANLPAPAYSLLDFTVIERKVGTEHDSLDNLLEGLVTLLRLEDAEGTGGELGSSGGREIGPRAAYRPLAAA